jgi:hypothetical protein
VTARCSRSSSPAVAALRWRRCSGGGGLRSSPAPGTTRLRRALCEGLVAVLARDVQKRVDRRLKELYERYRYVDLSDVATFYEPGTGYCRVDQTTATHDQFAIALASTGGDLQSVGDDELPFALQSVSKVFVYGLALADRGREHVLRRVGVGPCGAGRGRGRARRADRARGGARARAGRGGGPLICLSLARSWRIRRPA